MKKTIVLFIFVVMVLVLLGCSTNNNLVLSTNVSIESAYSSTSRVIIEVVNYGDYGKWEAIVYDDGAVFDTSGVLYIDKNGKDTITLDRPAKECTLKVYSYQDSEWVETESIDVPYKTIIVNP